MAERQAFRPDLEGLRGVAILLVVLFHAGVAYAAGGFVGVDVFFVLSGFFITRMLFGELSESGTVDLTAFWGNRALRLLPALLVVLLLTLGLVMWLYAPIDRADIARNARAVALYSGNIEFARNAIDYFRTGENPYLHTWSLGVEEQFYLVWPLLFLGAAGLAAQSLDGEESHSARIRLLWFVATVGLISFGVAVWLTGAAQPWAFFGMPTRIWEFAAGGALALVLNDRTDFFTGAATAMQVIGVAVIGIAVLRYDPATPYPGLAAVVPAVGALALIVGGSRAPDSFVSRGLSIGPLRWLGRMSYAWYLWHWPLIGVAAVIDPQIGVNGRLIWAGIALVLAWLTYRYVEQPARNGGVLARVPVRWMAPVALGASVAAAGIAHFAMRASERTTSMLPQKRFAAAREDRMSGSCWTDLIENWNGACEFGDRTSSVRIALLGDSHAEHWLGGLDAAGKAHGWKILEMVKGGCPIADVPQRFTGRLKHHYRNCVRFREGMLRELVAMKPDAVILSNSDHYVPLGGDQLIWQIAANEWRDGLRRTYERLSAAGIRVVVMRATPWTYVDAPVCLSRYAAKLPFARPCVYDRAKGFSPLAIKAQDEAAHGLNVRFLDMNDRICTMAKCSVIVGGMIAFTDDNHLTATFSRSLAPVLGQRLASAIGFEQPLGGARQLAESEFLAPLSRR